MAAGNTRTKELAHGAIAHVDKQIQVAGFEGRMQKRRTDTCHFLAAVNARLSSLRHRFTANGVTNLVILMV